MRKQRGKKIMSQKTLPFKYEEGKKDRGVTSLGVTFIFRLSSYHWTIQVSEGTYTDKRGWSGLDRLTGHNVIDIVESCGRRLCRGFEYFRSG